MNDPERNRYRSVCFMELRFPDPNAAFTSSILVLSFVIRDNNTLEQANRKLERKMKEITMQLNDEHLSLQNQMDQVRTRDLTT